MCAAAIRLSSSLLPFAAQVEKYRNDPLVYHGKLKAKWGVAMLNATDFIVQHFSEITIPLLLVHGDADQLVHIGSSQFGYKAAGSTDKTFEVFKGGFHEALHDLERDRFLILVGEWLDQRFDKEDRSAAAEGTTEQGQSQKDAPGGGEPPEDSSKAGEPPKDVPPVSAPPEDEGTVQGKSTENAGLVEGESPKDPPTEEEPPNDVAPEEPQSFEQVPEFQGAVEDEGKQDT